MAASDFMHALSIALYALSSFATLWAAAFAYYALRRKRGLPLALLCGVTAVWNLSKFFLSAITSSQFPEFPLLFKAFDNLSHLSFSLVLPFLYVVVRGDGFRGIRRSRKFWLIGVPLAANAALWFFKTERGAAGPHPVVRAAFAAQFILSLLLILLSVYELYRRRNDHSDRERLSVVRVLVGTIVFSLLFGFSRFVIRTHFDPAPVAVAFSIIIVAAGYHKLDPFSAAAENENRLKRFEFMADASQEYMSIINREYRYEAVNAAFCQSMKRSRDEIIGRGVVDIWGVESFKESIESPLKTCLSGSSLVFRRRFAFGNEPPRFMEISYNPFVPPLASEPSHAVVVTKDITDYVRKEEELEDARKKADAANAAKSDFLAAMSHEIRTPINAVMGLTDLALKKDLDPELRDDLETVKAASVNLLALVNEILDLSKIEAGGIRLERVAFNPIAAVERTIKSFRPAVSRKGISLDIYIDPRVPAILMGDPLRFNQVLFNLIGNAVKFTERGGIDVSVHPLPHSGRGDGIGLRVEVRDTGIGIPADRLDAIFDSFSQASEGTSRKYGGSGLGLTISRRLARLLGGDVSVESVLGSGSSFIFDAQFQKAPAEAVLEDENSLPMPVPAAKEAPRSIQSSVVSSALPILLVEDNPINVRVAMRFLESVGRYADCAASGSDALRFLRNKRYCLVLSDVELPEMDGLELTRRIRSGEAGESARAVPIVAMTAHSGPEIRAKCAAAGMDDFVCKPLDFPALESILSRFDHSLSYQQGSADAASQRDASSARASSAPVLDRKNTLARLGGDAELVNELYGILRAEAPDRLAQALSCAESNDFAALAALAHQVKGSSSSLGAVRLSEASGALQKAAEAKDGELISVALASFLETYKLTCKQLEA